MVVTSGNEQLLTRGPVPHPGRLVVGRTQQPIHSTVWVELHCAYVVQMAYHRADSTLAEVVEDVDLVVIATSREHTLRRVEVDTADGEQGMVRDGQHGVVGDVVPDPHLAAVEPQQQPLPFGVKTCRANPRA